ncbi:MAG TPA: HD domain-containing phosphohydrolase [bacterium]|nr:HD domain-containing phosphohydrolase [bacterium]
MEYIYGKENPRILVVDDEKVIRSILSDFLSSEGCVVKSVEDGLAALTELETHPFDLMITDLMMPQMGGIDLLKEVRKRKFELITIIMTGFGTVETAIQAMKQGAYDYILKPFKMDELLQIIKRALEKQRLEQENVKLKEVMSLYKVSEAMTTSLSLEHILQLILETTKSELEADAVNLILEEERDYPSQPTINISHTLCNADDRDELLGDLDYGSLLGWLKDNPFLIVPGAKGRRFFKSPPERKGLSSLLSVPLKVRDKIVGTINVYSYMRNFKYTEGQAKLLIILASRAAQAIENARLFENLQRTFRETIQGLVSTLEAKDKYTSGHSRRVTELAVMIARELKLSPEELEKIEWAGLLHDIGKIGIKLEALNKPEKITREEHEMFKDHCVMGKQILESIHFLRDIVPLVYFHHEWYDGEGYPDGIRGDKIPLGARILAVADSYDAMTSDRPYRKAMNQQKAIKELRRFSGTQFDAGIVEVFVRIIEDNQKKKSGEAEKALESTRTPF